MGSEIVHQSASDPVLVVLVCREQLPVVVFCFSKKRCDSLVDSLASLDLTSADEKSDIQVGASALQNLDA